jgi:hypothetical protein
LYDTEALGSSIEWSTGQFVRLDGGIGWGENGEWARSSKGGSNTGFLKSLNEKSEVIVSLKFTLFESLSDSISSPYLSRSLKSCKSVNYVGIKSRGRTSLYRIIQQNK